MKEKSFILFGEKQQGTTKINSHKSTNGENTGDVQIAIKTIMIATQTQSSFLSLIFVNVKETPLQLV